METNFVYKYKISTTVRGADKPIARELLIMFPQTYGAYSAHNQQQRPMVLFGQRYWFVSKLIIQHLL